MKNYPFNRRALLSLGTVTILAPALRIFPSAAVHYAGRAAWLSAIAALPVTLGYVLFLSALMSLRHEGEGLPELMLRMLGDRLGKAALIFTSAWLILYAGFELRSGSDRLIITVYPNSAPALFSVIMGIVALIAALGSMRSIVRSARIIMPVVIGTLITVLIFAAFSVQPDNLLPVVPQDTVPVFIGSLAVVDIISVGAYSLCFFEGALPKASGRRRAYIAWVLFVTLLLSALGFTIIGCFGAEITNILTRPFFVLVRNLVFFQSVERVEALVVMLWIFPDFLQASLLLFAAQHSLRLALGMNVEYSGEGIFDFSGGRYIIWLVSAAAIIIAVFIAPDSISMNLWSQTVIPALNLAYGFLFLPIIYIVGKFKNRA